MNQAKFQSLADCRIQDAKVLLNEGRWDAAYYLSGYAVECALKSCIIKRLMATDEFPDKNLSANCYKHDLSLLRRLAGLDVEMDADKNRETRWTVVKDWSEQSRYETGATEQNARTLFEAITNQTEGVLPWIQSRW